MEVGIASLKEKLIENKDILANIDIDVCKCGKFFTISTRECMCSDSHCNECFVEKHMHDCGHTLCQKQYMKCNRCQKTMCGSRNSCQYEECRRCEKDLCKDCRKQCKYCGKYYCSSKNQSFLSSIFSSSYNCYCCKDIVCEENSNKTREEHEKNLKNVVLGRYARHVSENTDEMICSGCNKQFDYGFKDKLLTNDRRFADTKGYLFHLCRTCIDENLKERDWESSGPLMCARCRILGAEASGKWNDNDGHLEWYGGKGYLCHHCVDLVFWSK